MADEEYIERGALIQEISACTAETWGLGLGRSWWSHSVQLKDNMVRCINKQPAVDAEELACRFVSEEMRMIVSLIARGLRHVALPEEMPERIGIVIDYPQTTVRYEFVPRNDENE